MPETRRPSIISKRTHVRKQKHAATFSPDLPASPRTIGRLIVGLGFAGIGAALYQNHKKLTPWEIVGILLGSLTLGYAIFDLGKRNGMIQGASFALRSGEENEKEEEEEDWRGEFKGKEFQELKFAEKIAWLRKEEAKIKSMQEDEQFKCGKAYIQKEEAYEAYEKHGGMGGMVGWIGNCECFVTSKKIYEKLIDGDIMMQTRCARVCIMSTRGM